MESLGDQQAEWNEANAHLHVIFDDVVLNPLKPVLEVAYGDNKVKLIYPKSIWFNMFSVLAWSKPK